MERIGDERSATDDLADLQIVAEVQFFWSARSSRTISNASAKLLAASYPERKVALRGLAGKVSKVFGAIDFPWAPIHGLQANEIWGVL